MDNKSLANDRRLEVNQLLLNTMEAFYDQNQGRSVLMEASKKLGCVGESLPNVVAAVKEEDPDKIAKEIDLLTTKFAEARKHLEKAVSLTKK